MVKAKLAILICTIPERASFLERLNLILLNQGVWFLTFIDHTEGISIGEKRNKLLQAAADSAEYVAFIDDDDIVPYNYAEQLLKGIDSGADCCSLKGIINDRGAEKVFIHSLKYDAYADNGVFYERYPNHLNCIRADIAKQFRFPEINHGEDTDWATQIHNSGLLKTEYWIDDVLYYYNPSSNRK